jgi:ribulose 1,5-bisphosphate synthetase/thiazole synthase
LKIQSENDVVIVGGGPAGVAAAVSAARNGADVILIERYGFLGGAPTNQYVSSFYSFYDMRGDIIVRGIAQEIVDRLTEMNGTLGHLRDWVWWSSGSLTPCDPELLKYVLLQMVEESGVKILLHTIAVDAICKGNFIKGVVIENKSGRSCILGKIVIDASGDADVAAAAGVQFEKGRKEDGSMQHMSLFFRVGNVKQEKILDYVRQNPDDFIIGENPYNRRSTKETIEKFENMTQAPNLAGFFSLVRKAVNNKDMHTMSPRGGICLIQTPRKDVILVYGTNVANVDGTNAWDLTRAEVELRKQVILTFNFLKKYVPGFEEAYLIDTAPQVGVRETRRIVGEYVLSYDDVKSGRKFDDGIAKCSHPADIHSPTNATVIHEHVKEGSSYDIPYRCLIPVNIDNLLVAGRCISATHEALGSARVITSCIATGQAAGTAAALCIKKKCTPRQLDPEELRKTLREQGAII